MAIPTYELNDGHEIPQVGFGTYPLKGQDGIDAMVGAIEAGYRILDSAVNYENEEEVGAAVKAAADLGVAREELTITTKVPGRFHEKALAIKSVEDSLSRMDLDVLDLVLIHWPNPSRGLYVEAWEALVECRERGLVRSIGVSNFTEAHLGTIIDATGVIPAVNQVEIHPRFPQDSLLAHHQSLGIVTEAWSPLGKGSVELDAKPIVAAAEAHGVTPGQAVLRWHIERDVLPLPKSEDPERQKQNLDIFGFELSTDEVAAITRMGVADGRRFDGDPDTHEEM